MAKKITWSQYASRDRIEIIKYWNSRNKSTEYSKKLRVLFQNAINTIQIFPHIGEIINQNEVRVKLVRDYYIVYKEYAEFIRIIAIWDCRQNPEKFEHIIKR